MKTKNINILAIDTATEACSAAVLRGSQCFERYQLAPREHNLLILPMIESVLEESGLDRSEIDLIAFGQGPGSFTGVRITAGVAQGIAFGADIPVIGISTLAAMVYAVTQTPGEIGLSCIDARMGEVYWGAYQLMENGELLSLCDERVCAPDQIEVPQKGERVFGVGSGWETYRDPLLAEMNDLKVEVIDHQFPRASAMAHLAALEFAKGRAGPPITAQPVYLRNKVAKKPGER